MTGVKRTAAILSYATLGLIGLVLLAALVFLVRPDLARGVLIDASPVVRMDTPPGTGTIYAVQAVGWLVLAVILFVLWHIHGLFRLYAQGQALSDPGGRRLRWIGIGLMLLPVAVTIFGAASSVLLSWNNGPGAREVSLGINLQAIGFVIGGALLLFVGMTIREAAEIAEDNRGFV